MSPRQWAPAVSLTSGPPSSEPPAVGPPGSRPPAVGLKRPRAPPGSEPPAVGPDSGPPAVSPPAVSLSGPTTPALGRRASVCSLGALWSVLVLLDGGVLLELLV